MRETAQPVIGEDRVEPYRSQERSGDGVDVLTRRLDDICTRAVDPLQIAAALEADGIGDQVANERFGHTDVFALAEDIYDRVPLRVEPFQPRDDTEQVPAWRDLSRGILFVLPGGLYIAAVHGFSSPSAAYALLAALIFAWVWGQGSGYLGHILIGRNARGTARRLVLRASAVGVTVATVVSMIAVAIGGLSSEIIVATFVQAVYLLAASVLLLFARDHLLFAILVPGVIVSSLLAFGPAEIRNAGGAAAVVVVTVGIVALVAFVGTRNESDANRAELTRTDYLDAIPHMALGLAWASLVSFSALVTLDGASGAPSTGLTILPLLLSMGVAEWSLRRYLRMSSEALRRTAEPSLFVTAAHRAMWSTMIWYTVVIAALTGTTALLLSLTGRLSNVDVIMMIAFTQLGASFLLGQILASRLRLKEAILISIATVVMLAGIAVATRESLGSTSLEVSYLISVSFLAIALLIRSRAVVGLATTYR